MQRTRGFSVHAPPTPVAKPTVKFWRHDLNLCQFRAQTRRGYRNPAARAEYVLEWRTTHEGQQRDTVSDVQSVVISSQDQRGFESNLN